MEHSRVQKFKSYRDSFTKLETPDIGEAKDIISGLSKTKSLEGKENTLPFDEVVKTPNSNNKIKRKRMMFTISKIILGIIILALVVGLIILGINAFHGGK